MEAKAALKLFYLVSITSLASNQSFASGQDLFALSLEELLDIEVSVSSHTPEPISQAAAIVSSYKMDELERMGLKTLKDALAFVPGVLVQDHLFGQPFVSIRGVYEGFNQKVLFLVDDVPYFMSSHSDIPLLGIPIASIDKIEVIRGPGAVYYGTNATAGVIKVITKNQNRPQQSTLTMGENNFVNGNSFNHFNYEQHQFRIGVEYQSTDGYDAYYPAFSLSGTDYQAGTIEKPEETLSALLQYNYHDFALTAQVFESSYTGLAQPTRQLNNINDLTYTGSLLAAQYQWQIAQTKIKAFADYNRMYLDFYIQNFAGAGNPGGFVMDNNGKDNYRARSGVTVSSPITSTLEFFAGAEAEKRATESYQIVNHAANSVLGTIMPAFDLMEYSAYAQLDYRYNDTIRFLIGGRYTDNELTGSDTVPRLAAVYTLNQNSSLKLLYSVGFNSPSFTQLKADFAPVVEGNTDLTPEKVETYDLAYHYSTNELLVVANLFRLEAQDFILSDRSTGTINFYNAADFKRYGAELDIQYNVTSQFKLSANVSHLKNGNQSSQQDLTRLYTPSISFNVGTAYQMGAHGIGASLRHIGKRAGCNDLNLINLDYRYSVQQWQLIATVENALDEEVLNPNMGEFNERPVPGGAGRNLKLSARYNY